MAGFRDAFLRWRWLSILTRDAIGTAVFAIFAFAPALASNPLALAQLPVRHGGAFALVLDLAQVVPLAGRRRWPAWCLAVVGVGFAAYQCLGYPGSFSSVGLIFALYAAGAHQQRHRRLIVAAATAGYAALAVALAALHSPSAPSTTSRSTSCSRGAGAPVRWCGHGSSGRPTGSGGSPPRRPRPSGRTSRGSCTTW